MRLSKYEKETIILTSEGDDTVQIYTFNASLKRRLAEYAEYAEKYPHLARLDRWTAEGSVTCVLDKSRVSIRLLPPLSEERRKVFSECGKKYGMNASRRLLEKVVT